LELKAEKLLKKIKKNFWTTKNWHELGHVHEKVMHGDSPIKNCGKCWETQTFINYHISVCMARIIGQVSEAS